MVCDCSCKRILIPDERQVRRVKVGQELIDVQQEMLEPRGGTLFHEEAWSRETIRGSEGPRSPATYGEVKDQWLRKA